MHRCGMRWATATLLWHWSGSSQPRCVRVDVLCDCFLLASRSDAMPTRSECVPIRTDSTLPNWARFRAGALCVPSTHMRLEAVALHPVLTRLVRRIDEEQTAAVQSVSAVDVSAQSGFDQSRRDLVDLLEAIVGEIGPDREMDLVADVA